MSTPPSSANAYHDSPPSHATPHASSTPQSLPTTQRSQKTPQSAQAKACLKAFLTFPTGLVKPLPTLLQSLPCLHHLRCSPRNLLPRTRALRTPTTPTSSIRSGCRGCFLPRTRIRSRRCIDRLRHRLGGQPRPDPQHTPKPNRIHSVQCIRLPEIREKERRCHR